MKTMMLGLILLASCGLPAGAGLMGLPSLIGASVVLLLALQSALVAEMASSTLMSSAFAPWMSLLTLWSMAAVYLSVPFTQSSEKGILKMKSFMSLAAVLLFVFNAHNFFTFYVAFEASLLPIMFIVLGWGYQPERVYAALSMFFYTVVASLPLLVVILLTCQTLSSSADLFFTSASLYSGGVGSAALAFMALAGMLVKLPLFMAHLWLPRAHVEAPMGGSMVLAAVMLKLGAFGVIRLLPWAAMSPPLINSVQVVSVLGGLSVAITCLRQNDMKVLIAYSSVAHMALALSSLLLGFSAGVWAAVIALLSHGLVSSGLFMGANFLYSSSNSRNMLLLKTSLTYVPLFSALWFILCLGNMGGPPSLNLLAEILMLVGLGQNGVWLLGPGLGMAGLATAFTLNLYMATQHHQPVAGMKGKTPEPFWLLISGAFHTFPVLAALPVASLIF